MFVEGIFGSNPLGVDDLRPEPEEEVGLSEGVHTLRA